LNKKCVVFISANTEWRVIRKLFPQANCSPSLFGEWFEVEVGGKPVMFFHGGWGKIAAAASTQYVIDRWLPALLVNLGTCGGFEGAVEKGTIILAERTLVYDIVEQMGDYAEHIAHYTTDIDLAWLGEEYPQQVKRTLLVSGDRDLIAEEIPQLREKYGAVAGDWESGAIAWVAAHNHTRCLILRGVTDLVGSSGGEAYAGNVAVFEQAAEQVLTELIKFLPGWIAVAA
jgi:adenosylhomocysteine nucleosidase